MGLAELDRITNLLTDFLDVQSRRAEIVASNLANADTPEYKAKRLEFDEYLRNAVRDAIAPRHAAAGVTNTEALRVVEQTENVPGIDGNTVDTEREMATLAETGGKFMTGTQLLQMRFRTLRAAIKEGR
ncbi:MAG: flagellar basal body rod protein FlgB [Acidobacteria bacterium]|nr:flagellar basal body rod protein FlgB [Acidobacteriota bacterium]MBI3427002.1 flagellar basal body rod protein FlgB [Acidobacteriota bacterium]